MATKPLSPSSRATLFINLAFVLQVATGAVAVLRILGTLVRTSCGLSRIAVRLLVAVVGSSDGGGDDGGGGDCAVVLCWRRCGKTQRVGLGAFVVGELFGIVGSFILATAHVHACLMFVRFLEGVEAGLRRRVAAQRAAAAPVVRPRAGVDNIDALHAAIGGLAGLAA